MVDGYSDNGWGVGVKHSSVVALTKYTMEGRIFGTVTSALAAAHPGQTICLSPGMHYSNGSNDNMLRLAVPVRLIAGDGLGDVAANVAATHSKHIPKGAFNGGYGGGSKNEPTSKNDLVTLCLDRPMEITCKGTVHMYGLKVKAK